MKTRSLPVLLTLSLATIVLAGCGAACFASRGGLRLRVAARVTRTTPRHAQAAA